MTIYRVHGYYASGRLVSHLVGDLSASDATASVLASDSRIIRIIKVLPTLL